MKIELKKMISLINKIDKDNGANIIAFFPEGKIIVGNYNYFFEITCPGKISATENIFIPFNEFPVVEKPKNFLFYDNLLIIKTDDNGTINVPISEMIDASYVEEFDAIVDYLDEKNISKFDTFGGRSFISNFNNILRVYTEHKKAFIRFSKIGDIFFDKKYAFTTNGFSLSRIESKTDLPFVLNNEIIDALKLFNTPFSICISEFPTKLSMKHYDDDATEEEKQKKEEDAYIPQVMISSPNLRFIYSYTSKELPGIPDHLVVFPKEEPLSTFMLEKNILQIISKTASSNNCEKINFMIDNGLMSIWANNHSEVIIKDVINPYILKPYTGRTVFALTPRELKNLLDLSVNDYLKINHYGFDKVLVSDDDNLVMPCMINMDEIVEEHEEIFKDV